jgi:hypothetical protein
MTRLYFAMLKQTEKVNIIRDLASKKFKDKHRRNEWLIYLAKNERILFNMQRELGDYFCYATEINNFN